MHSYPSKTNGERVGKEWEEEIRAVNQGQAWEKGKRKDTNFQF